MTQEQAKHSSLYFLYEFEEERKEKCFKFIEELFTDFKLELEAEYQRGQEDVLSRSCEGCKHHRESELADAIECIKGIALFTSDYGYFVDRDFSCNRWEQK